MRDIIATNFVSFSRCLITMNKSLVFGISSNQCLKMGFTCIPHHTATNGNVSFGFCRKSHNSLTSVVNASSFKMDVFDFHMPGLQSGIEGKTSLRKTYELSDRKKGNMSTCHTLRKAHLILT